MGYRHADGRMGLLHRPGYDHDLGDSIESALVGHTLVAPGLERHVHPLDETLAPPVGHFTALCLGWAWGRGPLSRV